MFARATSRLHLIHQIMNTPLADRMLKTIACVFFVLITVSAYCQVQKSDARATAIADSVVMMMGGREHWDQVQFIRWNFFGRRTLYWNKWNGDVRIEIPSKQLLLLTNLNTGRGHVYRNQTELLQPDTISYFMDRAYKIWANDSYWLIMPFKMHDAGVRLVYLGHAEDSAGVSCQKLELTFENVGVTPENKYHIYVDRKSYLVTQWDYFEKATDSEPSISNPWSNYRWYGKILLSDDRGTRQGKLTDIGILKQLPEGFFERP